MGLQKAEEERGREPRVDNGKQKRQGQEEANGRHWQINTMEVTHALQYKTGSI